MDLSILHELINRYEANFDLINGEKHDELFKWRAMKVWRDEWNKPKDAFPSFADRFNAARKEFSLFIDNSRMHPSTGIVKLWEKEPKTVERLFYEVLLADAYGDISVTQAHMDQFLDEYELLRQKYFPGNWSFKQDRHSASVFLAMNTPDTHFVYKSSEAGKMAKYIDFGVSIGSGTGFSLRNYYRLCEEIVAALKEHESLLEKHFSRLTGDCYVDHSLHLMAFDLMYCCRTYNFYHGIIPPVPFRITQKKMSSETEEVLVQKELVRQERIAALEQKISELEKSCDDCSDIQLIGVQVFSAKYGMGLITSQAVNQITVRFAETEKSFILDKKYAARPRFEDDDTIIDAFSAYGQAQENIKRLQRQLETLRMQGK